MVLLMPLLEGTDGKIKMSKSYPEHCINLTDTPENMLGKLMSIPDALLSRYELLMGLLTEEQIEEQTGQIRNGDMNPRDIKMHMARYLITQYHSPEAADRAEQAFVTQFQKREIPDDIPEVTLNAGTAYVITELMMEHELAPSRNEARRLIQGGGVKLDGEKISDTDAECSAPGGTTMVLQVGKRKFLRLQFQ